MRYVRGRVQTIEGHPQHEELHDDLVAKICEEIEKGVLERIEGCAYRMHLLDQVRITAYLQAEQQ